VRITTIIENEALEGSGLEGRFGLSLHLENHGRRILFDCGPDEACLSNAARLGISLENLDAIVLSHAHYDYTGGLAALLERNPATPVYLSPSCRRP
jgi:7,8-dihydropterin-6-yl-methyl-4-(beta-D-ribofuranosyl)aminobenzene 5'-phosphate synthase